MNGKVVIGSILILLGVLFLLENAGVWAFGPTFHEYWPALLVLWGIWLLVRRGSERKERPIAGPETGPDAPEQLNESRSFGDIVFRTASKKFKGGSISGVFGNIRVDASDAGLVEGEQTLAINGVFGDIRIILPKNVPTSVNASTVFGQVIVNETRQGGFAPTIDLESPGYNDAPRKLRVRVSQVFGKVEVRQ
jgi:lia operon protein LiaF